MRLHVHGLRTRFRGLTAIVGLCLGLASGAFAQTAVLQRGYDAGVSGANLNETTLNTGNVKLGSFGLVFKLPVDDNVFAQPLYVPNVVFANQGTHNIVYVATMSDTVYAFDADSGALLGSINLASLVGSTPVPMAQFAFAGNRNIVGNLGILSTPVIDPSTQIMYVVAATLENNTIAYRLHALDIRNGAEPYGPGVLITGSYGGATFSPRYQTQRVSLALSGGQVVFGFGAVELEYAGGYTGWVMAYDKKTLKQTGAIATVTVGNGGGGVWQSGRPPVVDSAGYAYVFTGNAYGNGYDGVKNFGESVLKLDPAHGLAMVDWFTPGNWASLDASDLDLTSSGPMLIPGTSVLAGGGKTGDLYLLNTASLGKFNANDSQVVQKLNISASELRGGPVFWQRPSANGGPLFYNWGVGDNLRAYAFNGSTLATTPSAQSNVAGGSFPGGLLSLSANGGQVGSGIVWATTAAGGDAENNPPVGGVLHAFDAGNVATEIWNSTLNASRDGFGNLAKFVPPLVANGRVYVATSSNQVAVYGLLSSSVPTPVSLSAAANIDGIFAPGKFIYSGGLDGYGVSYSSTALGTALSWSGVGFNFGSPDTLDAVSAKVVTLPAGQFGSLRLLATSVDGNSTGQVFTVTYTDGSSTSATLSLSDWCRPQAYAGETNVKSMSVRVSYLGQTLSDCPSVNLYGYRIALNPGKTVQSISLPNNRSVVLLAATLGP